MYYIDEEKNEPIESENESESVDNQEVTNEQAQQVNDSVLVVNKLTNEDKSYDLEVEEERQILLTSNKRARVRSNICSIIIIGLLVLSVIFINNQEGLQFISFISLGVAVVTIIVFMILNKRVDRPDVQGYIKRASLAINRYVFNNQDFKDVTYDPLEKLELSDVNNDNLYIGLTKIASRNITRGHYLNRSFLACELALFLNVERKQQTCFVGKYLVLPNDLNIEGQYIISLSSDKPVDISNNLSSLSLISEMNNIKVYGPENGNVKDLGNSFIDHLKKIRLDERLLGVHVSLIKGRTAIYASYDDDTITLPFNNPYKKETAEHYKNDLMAFLDAAHTIIKD